VFGTKVSVELMLLQGNLYFLGFIDPSCDKVKALKEICVSHRFRLKNAILAF